MPDFCSLSYHAFSVPSFTVEARYIAASTEPSLGLLTNPAQIATLKSQLQRGIPKNWVGDQPSRLQWRKEN